MTGLRRVLNPVTISVGPQALRNPQLRAACAGIGGYFGLRWCYRLACEHADQPAAAATAGGAPGRAGAATGEAQVGVFEDSIFQGVEGDHAESTPLPERPHRIW